MDVLPLMENSIHTSANDYGSFNLTPLETFREIITCSYLTAADYAHLRNLSKSFYNVITQELPEYFIVSKLFAIYDNFKNAQQQLEVADSTDRAIHYYVEHACMKPIIASNGLQDIAVTCQEKDTGSLVHWIGTYSTACDCINVSCMKELYSPDYLEWYSGGEAEELSDSNEDWLESDEDSFEYYEDGRVEHKVNLRPKSLNPATLKRQQIEARDKVFKIKVAFSRHATSADVYSARCWIRGHLSEKVARAVESLMEENKINLTKLNRLYPR
jgi:hypothetical protein